MHFAECNANHIMPSCCHLPVTCRSPLVPRELYATDLVYLIIFNNNGCYCIGNQFREPLVGNHSLNGRVIIYNFYHGPLNTSLVELFMSMTSECTFLLTGAVQLSAPRYCHLFSNRFGLCVILSIIFSPSLFRFCATFQILGTLLALSCQMLIL